MGIDGYLMFAVGNNRLRHASSGDDVWGRGERIDDLIDEAVDHGGGAVDDATLHTFQSVATYQVGWLLNGY